MATKTISKVYSKGQQSHNYLEVLSLDGLKLRISIKRDAYDFQSHARIEAFSKGEAKWNFIHAIPYAEIQMKTSYVAVASEASFKADRDELVRVAKALLAE
jgi:hypothetical protein